MLNNNYEEKYFNQKNIRSGKLYKDYMLSKKVQDKFFNILLNINFFREPDFIVEVGCAYGFLIDNCFKKFKCKCLGIDISKYAIEKAKKINKDIAYIVGNIDSSLSINSGEVSNVILFDVIEHVKSPYIALLEINRILKNGGRLVIRTPNINSLEYFIRRKKFFGFKDETHLYLLGFKTLRYLLEKTGFKILIKGSETYPLPFIKNILIGGSYWIIAEKQ